MRIIKTKLIFLAAATCSMNGSQDNYAYYKDLTIKALLYPFTQFWNSSRATKVKLIKVMAVGALIILGGKKLKKLNQEIISDWLNEIERWTNNLKAIKGSQDKKASGKNLFDSGQKNLSTNPEALITKIEKGINIVKTNFASLLKNYPEQKTRFEKLEAEFQKLKSGK